MNWRALSLAAFGLSQLLFANSAWVVASNEILFIDAHDQQTALTGHSVHSSTVNPDNCHLWIQTGTQLLELSPSLQINTQIDSNDEILGDKLTDGLWLTVNEEIWTLRDKIGRVQSQFPAVTPAPQRLVSFSPDIFWTLDFKKELNSLNLVSFDSTGKLIISRSVSKKAELWTSPFLVAPLGTREIWIGYTAGTPSHSYSPQLERWSESGEMLNKHLFSHRGLFLGMALTPVNSIMIARDIPSDPFTVPLFTFIDEMDHLFDLNPLFSLEDNFIIRSMDSNERSIWTYEKSILGDTNKKIVKRDFFSSQEKVFPIKESAWKIHACSVQ